MKSLSKNLMCSIVWIFVLSETGYSAPVYAGKMEMLDYTMVCSFEEWYAGIEVVALFTPAQGVNLNLHYVQSVNVYDDSTPIKYKDGSDLPVPFIDPPPGGYEGDYYDYFLYYDNIDPDYGELEFPIFYDFPTQSFPDPGDPPVRLSFETWLVLLWQETFGPDDNRASDDYYLIEPLVGWTWSFEIIGEIPIFYSYDWKAPSADYPTNDWKTALGQVYGENSDWITTEIIYTGEYYVIPEPATLLLLGLGGLMLVRRRRIHRGGYFP